MFSHPFANHTSAAPFIVLSTVQSTNNYAMAKLHAGMVEEGTSFLAIEQTAGKGQRGRQWSAEPGQNITMSTVLQPTAYKPFLFSAAMALACYDFVKVLGIENASIKWPNDIYIGDRKAAGILIEYQIRNGQPNQAVVGTGINLNQRVFDDAGRPVSLSLVTGKHYAVTEEGRRLQTCLLRRHQWCRNESAAVVLKAYNDVLFWQGRELTLKKDSAVFHTHLIGVSDDGMLLTRDTMDRSFAVGEVEWLFR